MRGDRRVVAALAAIAAGTLLLLAGCGSSPSTAHTETPTGATREAVLRTVESAFFSSTGDSPELRLSSLEEVARGSSSWARTTFGATRSAPSDTRQGLAGGHDQGLLSQAGAGAWTWLGYLAPGPASCRSVGRSIPGGAARLLGLPPECAGVPTPSASPLGAPSSGVSDTTLTSGDEATMLSIFVTTKNSGPTGQIVTPTTIKVSASAPPLAALVSGGEWAMVTYVPAPGAPEPLTRMQLQDGAGTAFFLEEEEGHGWALRGLAGQPFCSGAKTAQVPPAVLTLWGHPC